MIEKAMAKSIRVLVVEDSPDYAAMLEEILTKSNEGEFNPVLVDSLSDALVHLQDDSFDLILMDLSLSDSKGKATFVRIGAFAPDTALVILTGINDRTLALEAVREGAQDYLIKGGTDPEQLERSLLYAIERQHSRVILKQQSFRDDLTGLLNRRGFYSLASKHLKLAQRESWDLALIYADLDDLKAINDELGHPAGDAALIAMANILRKTFRTSDLIARLGGDEFVVLAINTEENAVDVIVHRLMDNLDLYNNENEPKISFSYGVARYDSEQETALEELIADADRALYKRKNNKDIP